MVTRTVLVTGNVGQVYGRGLFDLFSIAVDDDVTGHATNSAYCLFKRLRPGQRVELVEAEHSWLGGKVHWSSTYVRVTRP